MTYTGRRLWHRVSVNGTPIRTAGDLIHNQRLGDLTGVLEFQLAEQPAAMPEDGDTVLVEFIDVDAELVYVQFGGTVAGEPEVESQPWRMVVRCVDQLDKLRNVRTGTDIDLTGMTDGEAWKAVCDDCGVTYDDADVTDAGYVLGERAAVAWKVDAPGSQIVQELDAVFGMATLTVGDNRVVRIHYDPTPSTAAGLYATYTRGASIDLAAHRRTGGGRERLQNLWVVRGAVSDAGDTCTAQPWARAADTTPQLGGVNRLPPQVFQSDLIQDEGLAEAVARRLMRVNNRLPAEAGAELVNDTNVRPGSKIAVRDLTYGIDADPRYYLVAGVDRTGESMTLALTAGPAGGEGTVTSGVDKVCNSLHTDLDWPGDFEFPGFDFPPLDLGLDLDFDLNLPVDFDGLWDVGITVIDNSSEAEEGGTCDPATEECGDVPGEYTIIGQLPDWVTDDGSWNFTGTEVTSSTPASAAHNEAIDVDEARSWVIRATGRLSDDQNSLEIGIGDTGTTPGVSVVVYGRDDQTTGHTSDFILTLYSWGGESVDITGGLGSAYPSDTDLTILLAYDAGTGETSVVVTDGVTEHQTSVTGSVPPVGPQYVCVRSYARLGVGSITFSDIELEIL